MKNKNTFYCFLILLLGFGSTNAQNTRAAFHNAVHSINAILKANPLAYYTDNKQNSAFIKQISLNEGVITFTDSIPKIESTTTNNKPGLIPDCCPPKTIRTLDLFAVKKWDIHFPYAYLKDKNNQIYGRIIGLRKADLYKLKDQFDKLKTLSRT